MNNFMPQQGMDNKVVHKGYRMKLLPSVDIHPFKAVAIFNDLVYITEYDNQHDFQSTHILPMNKKKTLYCGCINNENNYRFFNSDKQAIAGFKLMSYTRYGKLTDITKKVENKWTRIRWT